MSKVDDIKNRKRNEKQISPTLALNEEVNTEEVNVRRNEEINVGRNEEKKVERKRVSFDLRTDLHKDLKMQSLLQDKKIYILIEEALEDYLAKLKK